METASTDIFTRAVVDGAATAEIVAKFEFPKFTTIIRHQIGTFINLGLEDRLECLGARPISDNTLNASLRRLGYGKDEVTAHGFRATASSLLNECGKWHPDAIERQLAHIEINDVRRAYARGEFWD